MFTCDHSLGDDALTCSIRESSPNLKLRRVMVGTGVVVWGVAESVRCCGYWAISWTLCKTESVSRRIRFSVNIVIGQLKERLKLYIYTKTIVFLTPKILAI